MPKIMVSIKERIHFTSTQKRNGPVPNCNPENFSRVFFSCMFISVLVSILGLGGRSTAGTFSSYDVIKDGGRLTTLAIVSTG